MKEYVLPPALNKRLISRLLSSSSTPRENENFILKGSRDFNSRSNDVFGQLKTLEQSHEAWICENKSHDPFEEKSSLEKTDLSKQLEISSTSLNVNHNSSSEIIVKKKNKEISDVFKKPRFAGINRRKVNAAKSYLKYGKKWTKYSLANIPLCSNATNASIALSFINELRKSKMSSKEESNETNHILFSKPKICQTSSSCSSLPMDITTLDGNISVNKLEKNHNTIKLSHLEDDSE